MFDRGRDYYEILGFRDTVRTILEKGRRPGLRSNGQLFDELNPTMVYDRFSTTLSGPLYVPPVATTTPAPSRHEARLSAPIVRRGPPGIDMNLLDHYLTRGDEERAAAGTDGRRRRSSKKRRKSNKRPKRSNKNKRRKRRQTRKY